MAITFNGEIDNTAATASQTITLPNIVKPNDLIWVSLVWYGTTSAQTAAVNDNQNAGYYQFPTALQYSDIANNFQFACCWLRANSYGIPTLRATGLGIEGTIFSAMTYTGFANFPSIVTSDCTLNHGVSTTPSATAITNSKNPELVILAAGCHGGQNFSSVTGSFTGREGFGSGTANVAMGDVLYSSTGNSATFGATLASTPWAVVEASFADIAAPVYPPASPPTTPTKRKRPRQGGLAMGLSLTEWF